MGSSLLQIFTQYVNSVFVLFLKILKMSIKIASLNVNGLKDQGKATRLLCDLLLFSVDVTAIEETHFVCRVDAHVLPSDFVVYSAYGDRLARDVSLLVKHTLDAKVDLVYVDGSGEGWLIVVVYMPNEQMKCVMFFHQLGPFLVDSTGFVLMEDWNAILDPKIDRGWKHLNSYLLM